MDRPRPIQWGPYGVKPSRMAIEMPKILKQFPDFEVTCQANECGIINRLALVWDYRQCSRLTVCRWDKFESVKSP